MNNTNNQRYESAVIKMITYSFLALLSVASTHSASAAQNVDDQALLEQRGATTYYLGSCTTLVAPSCMVTPGASTTCTICNSAHCAQTNWAYKSTIDDAYTGDPYKDEVVNRRYCSGAKQGLNATCALGPASYNSITRTIYQSNYACNTNDASKARPGFPLVLCADYYCYNKVGDNFVRQGNN